jgi:HPt (histidine-containing phosphotransfer) domain-containing protein
MTDALTARQKLLSLAEDSGLSFGELVDLWTADTASQLALASAALSAGNLAETARLVHSASGASGICGVTSLADELRIVQSLAEAGRRDAAQAALEQAQTSFADLSGELHKGSTS